MKNISTALLNFHKEVGKIAKDANNPFFKSKYASLSNILSAIKEPLNTSNLVIVQVPTGQNELRTMIIHTESGEHIEGMATMLIAKPDIQGQGSALTYMRRYALGSMLGLNIDEDDDGNQATKYPKKAEAKAEAKKELTVKEKLFSIIKTEASIRIVDHKNPDAIIQIISDKTGVLLKDLKEITDDMAKDLIGMWS